MVELRQQNLLHQFTSALQIFGPSAPRNIFSMASSVVHHVFKVLVLEVQYNHRSERSGWVDRVPNMDPNSLAITRTAI